MSIEILDCLKRKRDICIKNIIPSENTAFGFTPALRWYDTLKYGDAQEKFNFMKIEDLRPLNTCQKHFQTILPNFPLDECEI